MGVRRSVLVVAPSGEAAPAVRALEDAGHLAEAVASVAAAAARLVAAPFDAVVALFADAPGDGLALVDATVEGSPGVPVVLAAGPVAAVEAMRHGAFMTVDPAAGWGLLVAVAERAADHAATSRLAREARDRDADPCWSLLGRSAAAENLERGLEQCSGKLASVLLAGEPGTGKVALAREIHARSPRAGAPFLDVSLRGVAASLVDGMLYGHRRGGTAQAAADHRGALLAAAGGTLLVEHVDALSRAGQARLAATLERRRVVGFATGEERPLEARVMASTEVDIDAAVRSGRFREDLHGRIGGFVLRLPPLRERRQDIPAIAAAAAGVATARLGLAPVRWAPDATAVLLAHPWPGNLRELVVTAGAAALAAEDGLVRAVHLPVGARAAARLGRGPGSGPVPSLRDAEGWLVAVALEAAGGNKSKAALRLGMTRKRFYRKLRLHGLDGRQS